MTGRTAGLLPPSHTETELPGGRPPFCCPCDKGLRVAWPGFPCPEPALVYAGPQIPIQVSAQCHLIGKACSHSPAWPAFSVSTALTQQGSCLLKYKITYFPPLEPAPAGQGSRQGAAVPPAPGSGPGHSLLSMCPDLQGSGWWLSVLDHPLCHNSPAHARP